MVQKTNLPWFGRVYVSVVIVLGFLVIGTSLYQLYTVPIPYQWFLLAALTLISGSATVKLPSSGASISISEVFVFAAVLLYGPSAGTIIVALDGLVISFWLAKRHSEPHRALFNMSAPAVSAWCSAKLFFSVSGIAPVAQLQHAPPLNQILPPLILFALTYFGLNTWLITFAIAFERRTSPLKLWISSFAWLSLNYFCGASVAVLLVVSNGTLDVGFLGVMVPLLLVLYFTFKTAMGRVDDADRHLQQLNALYLSTIETLAMAIDAKDQITHGHIRRVQSYAVGLAKRVGVADESLIKAIEAAALLHDMGKLAVPEYILNKPGKLTAAEFEKMKLHASVGADILSAIDFPYPVVPIVRHHHESWNGTGYPKGLKGTEIPIGARILSVVDCFDALTSDRPYRPRLSSEEAIKILLERRGNMYDPLVVDTFVRVHNDIAPGALSIGPPRHALNEIASSSQIAVLAAGSTRLDEIAASADEMLTLYELARALAGQAGTSDTGDVIAKHLRRLIPSSLCVFYIYDASTDELEAKHALGEAMSVVKGLKIPLGQRLSGWVAANRQTISNSDPSLDLGEVARCTTPRLRSCLSTPLLSDDTLVGALTLYSATVDGFSDDHRRIIEAVAKQIGHTFKSAAEFDNSAKRDALTGLPNLKQLEHLVDSAGVGSVAHTSLVLIDVVGLKQINFLHGRTVGDDVLRHVVRQTRAGLRVADILFRYGSDEFVALVNDPDHETASTLASRIGNNIRELPFSLSDGTGITIDATVTCVCAPSDGNSLQDLMTAARSRMSTQDSKFNPHNVH
jgi:diguanylate cyclase (GGDEF)-like protein/putative nucleotidyltransferase with HDIG domain